VEGRRFRVILREEPSGRFSVQCVELPGAVSQGKTREEALRNIREVIEGYLEAFPDELSQLSSKSELVEIPFQ